VRSEAVSFTCSCARRRCEGNEVPWVGVKCLLVLPKRSEGSGWLQIVREGKSEV